MITRSRKRPFNCYDAAAAAADDDDDDDDGDNIADAYINCDDRGESGCAGNESYYNNGIVNGKRIKRSLDGKETWNNIYDKSAAAVTILFMG